MQCFTLKICSKTDTTAINPAQLDTTHLSIISANQNNFTIIVHQGPSVVTG